MPKFPGLIGDYHRLAALADGQLWFMTGGSTMGVHNQIKILYTSLDVGAHWRATAAGLWPEYKQWPAAELAALGLPADPAALSLALPYDDQIADFGLMTEQRAVYTVRIGRPQMTSDGGRTWSSFFHGDKGEMDAQGGPIVVLDTKHAWVAVQTDIYYTLDGGVNWHGVRLPGSE